MKVKNIQWFLDKYHPGFIGSKHGRFTIKAFSHFDGKTGSRFLAECECGNTRYVTKQSMLSGTQKSCGCFQKEEHLKRVTKHGLGRHPVYFVWHQMMQRCHKPKSPSYPSYGGRGIFVAKEWDTFEKFYASFGKIWKKGLWIERIDNDGPYSLKNCKWATHREQQGNKRKSIRLTHDGRTMCLAHWAKEFGMCNNTVYYRYRRGLSFEEIFKR